jgi:hypothetical protein
MQDKIKINARDKLVDENLMSAILLTPRIKLKK